MKLSVVLATYNEALNIEKCLKSIKDLADEIIVVDGQSTDNTAKLAKQLGAKVFIEKNRPIFHINKQIALNKARGEWILQLDADEMVDKQLKKSIREIISAKKTSANGCYLKRKNYFLGHWLKKGGQYPDAVIRLVRRGQAKFPQKSVHEQIQVKGPVTTLAGHLNHYTAPTFFRYLQNSNRYTSLTAAQYRQKNIKVNITNWIKHLFIKPTTTFFNLYFRHKGFMDGFPGFVFALFSGLHFVTAFMKYWELNNLQKNYG